MAIKSQTKKIIKSKLKKPLTNSTNLNERNKIVELKKLEKLEKRFINNSENIFRINIPNHFPNNSRNHKRHDMLIKFLTIKKRKKEKFKNIEDFCKKVQIFSREKYSQINNSMYIGDIRYEALYNWLFRKFKKNIK